MRIGHRQSGWLACGWFCLLTTQAMAQFRGASPGELQPFPRPMLERPHSETGSTPFRPGNIPASAAARETTPESRVDHLRVAAENLQLAGFEREARELRVRAMQLEQEIRRSQSTDHLLVNELRELRESVNLLRQEVHILRRQLQLQLPIQQAPGSTPSETEVQPHEARLRLPDRKGPVSDEELDAPKSREKDGSPPMRKRDSNSEPKDSDRDVEFELVPVPAPSDASSEPAPTPAPTSKTQLVK